MDWRKWLRYLLVPGWVARRRFSRGALKHLEAVIAASEACHEGELRLVVEGCLPFAYAFAPDGCRRRALELFGSLGVWDTVHNSGVLIYVDLLDRQVEIVADRGVHARVGDGFWQDVCREMERAFARGNYLGGAEGAIARITATLATHFPAREKDSNELPDAPLVL